MFCVLVPGTTSEKPFLLELQLCLAHNQSFLYINIMYTFAFVTTVP